MQGAQLSLPLLEVDQAAPAAADGLRSAEKALGFIPNMYRTMANSPALFLTYQSGYEQFRSNTAFTPPEQEVVFLTISRENACTYCMAAHSFIAEQMSQVPADVREAIRSNAAIDDPKLRALHDMTYTLFHTRGLPSQADVRAFLDAGYKEAQILDIILAIAVKTLSNYSNHLTAPPVDEVFSSQAWRPAA